MCEKMELFASYIATWCKGLIQLFQIGKNILLNIIFLYSNSVLLAKSSLEMQNIPDNYIQYLTLLVSSVTKYNSK